MIWTQEQRDEMIRLWDNGKRSYSEIAKILGVTKNSVVGRMRREKAIRGLEVEDRFAHRTRTNKVYQKREKKMLTLPTRAGYVICKRSAPTHPKPDQGQLASIVDVTGCRWPVSYSDTVPGGHLFCNHSVEAGSYCPYHTHENTAAYSRALIRKTTRAALSAYRAKAA